MEMTKIYGNDIMSSKFLVLPKNYLKLLELSKIKIQKKLLK